GDLSVADEARKAGCATLVVLSKWDITTVEIDDVAERMGGKLRQRPSIITTSALTGRNVDKLLDAIEELFTRFTSRIGTGVLNRAVEEITAMREPPRSGRRRLNLLYATQYTTRPPRFRIVVNDRSPVPRRWFARVTEAIAERLAPRAVLLSLTKGLDPTSRRRMSELLGDVADSRRVAVLSGPNHAEEVARDYPTASVLASDDIELARRLQRELSTSRLRVYASRDVVGVELCAAAKNVMGLA